MATRLLPRDLNELYAHALVMEREAAKRFVELERYMRDAGMDHIADEFESIGKEEREQYELLAVGTCGREMPKLSPWEYAPHFLGPQADVVHAPRSVREALTLAIATERRTQNFYVDVAEHTNDDTMCAFAAEMAADESRHIARLERLLAREPDPAAAVAADGDVLPLKT
ncbi:MAG TPA: ferritin family protein [Burkholderiales bacterium]|nr:ferritin family protein [Burkholderiales bacterium]